MARRLKVKHKGSKAGQGKTQESIDKLIATQKANRLAGKPDMRNGWRSEAGWEKSRKQKKVVI